MLDKLFNTDFYKALNTKNNYGKVQAENAKGGILADSKLDTFEAGVVLASLAGSDGKLTKAEIEGLQADTVGGFEKRDDAVFQLAADLGVNDLSNFGKLRQLVKGALASIASFVNADGDVTAASFNSGAATRFRNNENDILNSTAFSEINAEKFTEFARLNQNINTIPDSGVITLNIAALAKRLNKDGLTDANLRNEVNRLNGIADNAALPDNVQVNARRDAQNIQAFLNSDVYKEAKTNGGENFTLTLAGLKDALTEINTRAQSLLTKVTNKDQSIPQVKQLVEAEAGATAKATAATNAQTDVNNKTTDRNTKRGTFNTKNAELTSTTAELKALKAAVAAVPSLGAFLNAKITELTAKETQLKIDVPAAKTAFDAAEAALKTANNAKTAADKALTEANKVRDRERKEYTDFLTLVTNQANGWKAMFS